MGYSIKKEHVSHNENLLRSISEKIANGEVFRIHPNEGQTASQIAYQLRNIFKSAETFDEFGFAHLSEETQIITKAKEVEIHPRYGFSAPKTLSDLDVLDRLRSESREFLTLTFRLEAPIENLRAALDEWEITSIRENSDGTQTASFRKETASDPSSPFSILSHAESEDYEEYLEGLLDEAE